MPTAKKKAGTKKTEVAQIKKTEILQSVGGLSLAGVAENLAKTSVSVQETLADVSNQMTAAIQQLGTVNAAIEAKQEELKTLHQIEVTALTLDELNGTIETTREAWADEQRRETQARAERQAEAEKARKRDEDDYNYRTAQNRRAKQDEFDAQLAAVRKQEEARKELLEKGWATREGELKARENELVALRDAVAKWPEEAKKASDHAVAVATNSLKANLSNQFALEKKDAETALKIAQNDKAASDAEIKRLQTTIADLQRQLDAAHKSSQEVASKALDSASGRAALETLQNSINRTEAGQNAGRRN
jgi:chromosome segregation ATPase